MFKSKEHSRIESDFVCDMYAKNGMVFQYAVNHVERCV